MFLTFFYHGLYPIKNTCLAFDIPERIWKIWRNIYQEHVHINGGVEIRNNRRAKLKILQDLQIRT